MQNSITWVDEGSRTLIQTPPTGTTPPTVSSMGPTNTATGVAVNSVVTATFSEAIVAASVGTSTFTLNGGSVVAGTITYSGTTATFTPTSNLSYNTIYTASPHDQRVRASEMLRCAKPGQPRHHRQPSAD